MGDDPERSVVDSYGLFHDVPNLFVGGSISSVTSTGLNPTLTILALAYRTAEHMLALWRPWYWPKYSSSVRFKESNVPC